MRRQEIGSLTSLIAGRTATRRELLIGSTKLAIGGTLAAVLTNSAIGQVFAQSTPVAGMNYPELTVTITKDALQPSATEIPAGYVLLTVVNQLTDSSDSAGILGPGPGQTMEQLQQAAATPDPQDTGFPPFLYNATVLGGPGDIEPGETGQMILQVPPGDWALFDEGNLPPVFITATGGTPAAQPMPTAVVTITEVDFAFGGFDAVVPTGKQVWQVTNQGKQPHMLVLAGVPDGTTVAQLVGAFSRPENATPPAGGLTEQDFRPVSGGVLLQSTGVTVWPIVDLEAGHYAAVCFVPDPRTGEPHAMEGMVAVFDVGESSATPAA
jgi:hypothetical protein